MGITLRPATRGQHLLHLDEPWEGPRRNRSVNHDPPRPKMATFEGTEKEDWDSFFSAFERVARRQGWTTEQRLDRLHESMRGNAARFIGVLPEDTKEDYHALCQQLKGRFACREPPSTSRQKLANVQQGGKSKEDYAEEVRRLVARAFPEVPQSSQDQFAAEAYARGLRNKRVAFQVLQSAPTTIAQAEVLAEACEHNYRATLREDSRGGGRAQRVSWADGGESDYSDEEGPPIRRATTPTYVTAERLRESQKEIEALLAKQLQQMQQDLLGALEARLKKRGSDEKSPATSRSPSPSTRRGGGWPVNQPRTCYGCGKEGHFRRECSHCPSPKPSGNE